MKVYEALVEACEAEQVGAVFGLMGDGNMLFMAEAAKRGTLELHRTRHEGPALTMAVGHARATGGVGVATVTCGPGLTQLGTALTDAARGNAPVVVIAGDTGPHDTHVNQYYPQRGFVEATGALYRPVPYAAEFQEVVGEAFHRARIDRTPVVLSIPMSVQEEELPWEWDYRPSLEAATVTPAASAPPGPEVAALAARLLAAERPVILAGAGGIGVRDALVELAERTGALLATSLRAKSLFDGLPYSAGIAGAFSTATARELFAEADVVLAVGASLNYYTTEGGYLFPGADVISVDLATPRFRREFDVAQTIRADANDVVPELLEQVRPRGAVGYRTAEVAARLRDAVPAELRQAVPEATALHPTEVIQRLDELLDERCRFVIGVGHFWSFPIMYLTGRGPDHYHVTYDFGSIGQGLPTALGSMVADRSHPTVVIEGDGSLLMHVQELETLARAGGPLLVVVMNDGAYTAETHKLRAKGYAEDSAVFGAPDLAAIARSFGVTATQVADLPALADAVAAFQARPEPTLLDVRISGAVVSAPFLRSIFGEDT